MAGKNSACQLCSETANKRSSTNDHGCEHHLDKRFTRKIADGVDARALVPESGGSGSCFPTIRRSSGRIADNPGVGDFALRCAVRDDLFVTPVLLDQKASQCFLEVGCRAPRAPAVILRLQLCTCFHQLETCLASAWESAGLSSRPLLPVRKMPRDSGGS